MNLKPMFATIAAASFATGIFAQGLSFSEDVRQALKGAADKAQASLASAKLAGQSASVFYIEGDSAGYVETLIRNAVVATGNSYVVPNNDDNDLLKRIYAEMEFDERKDGMLNPKTVERINGAGLKSTQVLIYGNVWTVVDNDRYTLVEMSLGAYSIETKEFLWAGSFDCRHYKPGKAPEIGIVDLPVELRETLQKEISSKVAESIKAQPRLKAIKTAAVLPLIGDETASISYASEDGEDIWSYEAPAEGEKGGIKIDGYITHIVMDGISRTEVTPKNAEVQTRAEVRRALRDKPQIADGILFGVVRGLDIRTKERHFRRDVYEFVVDVQLSIEDAASQDVLWSDTILERHDFEKVYSWWEWVLRDYPSISRSKFYVKAAGWILLGLVGLVVIGKILGAMTRVR